MSEAEETVRRPAAAPVLELENVSKAFGPVQALTDVSLTLLPGQVHCLAGENGAGKSTLIKVLTGAITRDTGTYQIEGQEVTSATPAALRAAGVQAVYQELSLLPHLSVAENLFMGRLPSAKGLLKRGDLEKRASEALEEVGLVDLDPGTIVERLPAATRQLVEIAKVLTAQTVKVIVFDEPTTALTEEESARLLDHIRRLQEAGRRDALHHPPAGGDVCDRRLGDRPEGRRPVAVRPDERLRREQADHRHGRPGDHRAVPAVAPPSPR